jgi:hypothetical protein
MHVSGARSYVLVFKLAVLTVYTGKRIGVQCFGNCVEGSGRGLF